MTSLSKRVSLHGVYQDRAGREVEAVATFGRDGVRLVASVVSDDINDLGRLPQADRVLTWDEAEASDRAVEDAARDLARTLATGTEG